MGVTALKMASVKLVSMHFWHSLVQNSSFLLSSYTALPLNLSSSRERGKVNFVLVSKFHTCALSWLKCI